MTGTGEGGGKVQQNEPPHPRYPWKGKSFCKRLDWEGRYQDREMNGLIRIVRGQLKRKMRHT